MARTRGDERAVAMVSWEEKGHVRWWRRKTVWLAVGVCVVVVGVLLVQAMARRERSVEELVRELREKGPNGRHGIVERSLDRAGMYRVAKWFGSKRSVVDDLIDAGVSALEPLVPVLGDKNEGIRGAAARVMYEIKDPSVVDMLIEALEDENPLVRSSAAKVLGWKRDMRATEGLARALRDESPRVRESAVMALLYVGDVRGVEPLIASLGDAAPDVRKEAARALGWLKDGRAVEPLIALLGDGNLFVRWSAVQALGTLRDPRAVEPLIMLMRDGDVLDRGRSAWALSEIGGSRAREVILAAVQDKDLVVVEGAHKLIIRMGVPGSEDVLIRTFKSAGIDGAEGMVQSFFFCGNAKLADTARAWVEEQKGDPGLIPIPANPVRWGSEGGKKDEG